MQKNLKDLVEIQLGCQFRKKMEPDPQGACRVIQIKDFHGEGRLDVETLVRVEPALGWEKYLVSKGDVLFLSRGHKNPAFPIQENLDNTIASAHFFILRMKTDSVLSDYLAWFINQTPAQGYIMSIARAGSHMPFVSKGALENLSVDVPSLEVQRAIVGVHLLWQRELALLKSIEERRRAIIETTCLKAAK